MVPNILNFRVFFHFAVPHSTPSLQPDNSWHEVLSLLSCLNTRSYSPAFFHKTHLHLHPSQSDYWYHLEEWKFWQIRCKQLATCGGIFVGNFHPRVKIFTRSSNYGNRPLSSSLLVSLCSESGFFLVRHVIWSTDGYLFGNMKNSVKAEMNKWFLVIKLYQFLV
ncbi:uncharacterized protein LOC144564073 isoform X1 [Carex rostrata]